MTYHLKRTMPPNFGSNNMLQQGSRESFAEISSKPERELRRTLFPIKLWEALNSPQRVIHWNEDGTQIIANEKNFEMNVMKSHPRLVKISSFLNFRRQLRWYGFEWNSVGDNPDGDHGITLEFHHPYFRRDKPELLSKIVTRRKATFRYGVSGITGRRKWKRRKQEAVASVYRLPVLDKASGGIFYKRRRGRRPKNYVQRVPLFDVRAAMEQHSGKQIHPDLSLSHPLLPLTPPMAAPLPEIEKTIPDSGRTSPASISDMMATVYNSTQIIQTVNPDYNLPVQPVDVAPIPTCCHQCCCRCCCQCYCYHGYASGVALPEYKPPEPSVASATLQTVTSQVEQYSDPSPVATNPELSPEIQYPMYGQPCLYKVEEGLNTESDSISETSDYQLM